jgi:sulfur-oxidizing protein SoxX
MFVSVLRKNFLASRVRLGVGLPRLSYVFTIGAVLLVAFARSAGADAPVDSTLAPLKVTGDEIRTPLTATAGDPIAGRAVVEDRKLGNCLSCHAFPLKAEDQGNVGPDLHGVGSRLKPAQLRLRIVNTKLIDPQTIMPAYYRTAGLHDVGAAFVGKTILDAQQVEDVVAFLASLKTGVTR